MSSSRLLLQLDCLAFLTCPGRSKVTPVRDGDGDSPEDKGDDRQQQDRPRERRLVLRAPAAIAERKDIMRIYSEMTFFIPTEVQE